MDFTSYREDAVAPQMSIKAVDPCDPLNYEFSDVTDLPHPTGTTLEWTVKDSAGVTTILTPFTGVKLHTFPSMNATYSVCLKATYPGGGTAQDCKSVTPKKTSVNLDFDKEYNSCPDHNFVVAFINKSETNKCPVKWVWDFDDGTPSSTDFEPVHTYVDPGTYTVKLFMTIPGTKGNPNQEFRHSEEVKIYRWQPDIAFTVCPDGHVTYETTADCNPKGLLQRCQRQWDFPGGYWHKIHRRRQKVRVCYDKVGEYVVSLIATNEDGGTCINRKVVMIAKIVRCCPNDKVKPDLEFDYQGKRYKMRTIFKYHGKLLGRIYAKTKLKVKKNNRWRRKRAYSIGVAFSGHVITKDNNRCFDANSHYKEGSKDRPNRAKVKKLLLPWVGSFRVKQDGLTCTHTVQVDANHTPVTLTNSLWANDCGCKGSGKLH